jgi:ribA/ribD-fused uncharacterized protein
MKTLVTEDMLPSPTQDCVKVERLTKQVFMANLQINKLQKELDELKEKNIVNSIITNIEKTTEENRPAASEKIQNARKVAKLSSNNASLPFSGNDILMFRGPHDPLSAFYNCTLNWKEKSFNCAEQAYQYAKLEFHDVPQRAISELLQAKNPYDCKRLAKQWVPKCSEKWEKVKFDVMEDICGTKAVQCFSFKEALIKTKDAHLLHNTETDPIWGCGRDLKGLNMMGIILMTVRDKINLFNEEFPPLIKGPVKPRNQEAPRKQEKPIKKPRSIVVGNSNVRGLSDGLQQRGIDSCGFVYPGQSVKKIAERVQFISSSRSFS